MKIVNKIQLKIIIFIAVENSCILHGRVFVIHKVKTAPKLTPTQATENHNRTTALEGSEIKNWGLKHILQIMHSLNCLVKLVKFAVFSSGFFCQIL